MTSMKNIRNIRNAAAAAGKACVGFICLIIPGIPKPHLPPIIPYPWKW
ncbi:MAG: hypothetical protein II922_11910 [Succinimonas sp.]|nr:hypothetical protein [Succinimonas sp.]MEE3423346.1 hypothetical protein [Succinimonas sp.]